MIFDAGADTQGSEDESTLGRIDSFVCRANIMRIYSNNATENMRIISNANTKEKPQGGKREGAGRPSQGKTRVNLTLSEILVEQARAKEHNLSALLDRLLGQWLSNENRPSI